MTNSVAKTIRQLAASVQVESTNLGIHSGVTRSVDENRNKMTHDKDGRCLSVYSPDTGVMTHFRYQQNETEPSLVVAVDTRTGDEAAWMKTGGVGGDEWVGVSNRGERYHDSKPPYDENHVGDPHPENDVVEAHVVQQEVPVDDHFVQLMLEKKKAAADAFSREPMTPEQIEKMLLEKEKAAAVFTREQMTAEEIEKMLLEKKKVAAVFTREQMTPEEIEKMLEKKKAAADFTREQMTPEQVKQGLMEKQKQLKSVIPAWLESSSENEPAFSRQLLSKPELKELIHHRATGDNVKPVVESDGAIALVGRLDRESLRCALVDLRGALDGDPMDFVGSLESRQAEALHNHLEAILDALHEDRNHNTILLRGFGE
jgi:hypothetical protein